MFVKSENIGNWLKGRIVEKEIEKYLNRGKGFISDTDITKTLSQNCAADIYKIRDILSKSLEIKTLSPDETATLLNVNNEKILGEMKETALKIKKKVYDNRIVTFAPLYLSNLCVNNCAYCGFKIDNKSAKRRMLSKDEIVKEIQVLAGEIGHKRLIVVYGEHPSSDIDYIASTINTIYNVKIKTKNGYGCIRRVNVNAAPMSICDLKQLKEAGLGTYQVFQETYSHDRYKLLHPAGTIKSNYNWRLYCMHRAFEAGIDDVGIGVLFGLYDWKFEVMGLLYHALELEEKFGIGPHTVSFPRLEPALNSPFIKNTKYKVSDDDFIKLITVIRLAIPYTGMIITARENASIRREAISLGITQTDASTKIGVGAYGEREKEQETEKQQFLLGDTRSLDEVIKEFADMGYITSFCTAGYRCGRTGKCIMDLLRNGQEGKFCKLNAVLTFREWIDDFASPATKASAEHVIEKEINEVKNYMPLVFNQFIEYYKRIQNGERDLYF